MVLLKPSETVELRVGENRFGIVEGEIGSERVIEKDGVDEMVFVDVE